MAKNWYPIINEHTCIECGKCVDKCTHGVYNKNSPKKPVVAFTDGCIDKCHGCGNLCPTGSITYIGDNTGWKPPNGKKEIKCCSANTSCCGTPEQSENTDVPVISTTLTFKDKLAP